MPDQHDAWIRKVLAGGGGDWDLVVQEVSSRQIVAMLAFDEVMRAAYQMLKHKRGYQSLREYATEMLDHLRAAHPDRWSSDWRNEAFLAFIADRARRIETRNSAWDRAFNLAAPNLTVEFAHLIARMTYDLETSPVNLDEAIRMLEGTMKEREADDAAERLSILYRDKGDAAAAAKWLARSKELRAQGKKLRPLLPPPLESESLF